MTERTCFSSLYPRSIISSYILSRTLNHSIRFGHGKFRLSASRNARSSATHNWILEYVKFWPSFVKSTFDDEFWGWRTCFWERTSQIDLRLMKLKVEHTYQPSANFCKHSLRSFGLYTTYYQLCSRNRIHVPTTWF
jgi:hypothetical protein